MNITAHVNPKNKWYDSICYDINVTILYHGSPLEFEIRYHEIHYENEKFGTCNELYWLATPEYHIRSKDGPLEPSFKDQMLDYFSYDYTAHKFKKFTAEEEQEYKKDIDQMWMIIKEELDRNNIPMPNWYFD